MEIMKKTLLTAAFVLFFPLQSIAGTYDDLITGAKMGDTREIRTLAAKGASLDTTDIDGNTLLMLAARDGHAELTEFLANNRAKLNARNAAGDTALGLAALRGHRRVVELLVSAGAAQDVPGWPPLVYAAFNGHGDIAAYLISQGADLNAASDNGTTALMAASRGGYIELVRVLLRHKADVNKPMDSGETALDIALKFKNTDIGELLRAAGGKSGKSVHIEVR
jgi:uncharacterized protein